MANIDTSLETIMQTVQEHATADHGRLVFPIKFIDLATHPLFLTGGGKYFNPATWANLTADQMGCFRLTDEGKLMVDATVSVTSLDLDGIYNAGTNPLPDNVGMIVHVNDAAPDETNQSVRTTGGVAQVTAITGNTFFGFDTRSQVYGYNKAGNLSPLLAVLCDVADFGLAVGVFDAGGNRLPAGDDTSRPIYTTVADPASVYTYLAGAVTKANIKASAGRVFSFTVTNRNGATRYLGLHNKATDPAGGEAPVVVFSIPAGGQLTLGAEWFGAEGIAFSTGIGWAIGTTVATFTDAATSTEHEVMIRYN